MNYGMAWFVFLGVNPVMYTRCYELPWIHLVTPNASLYIVYAHPMPYIRLISTRARSYSL